MAYDFNLLSSKIEKALAHLRDEVSLLRTGRASVQLLDPVRVEVYGSEMKLSEVAQVSAPDASQLIVKPWDQSILESIEKAISSSGLNLQPVVNGDFIRISIPPLTEERRKEMVKVLMQKIEQGKVMLRNVRNDAKKDIEKQKGQDGVSEDEIAQELKQMEEEIKTQMGVIDTIFSEKETELMKV